MDRRLTVPLHSADDGPPVVTMPTGRPVDDVTVPASRGGSRWGPGPGHAASPDVVT
jgi:hypothetical protein